MIVFIDDHRAAYGVEPICRVLPIAPSTCHAHAARRADPGKLPARVRSDAALAVEIRRVFEANFRVYGVRKVWRQFAREGIVAARCTLARLMRAMGLQGAGREDPHHDPRPGRGLPARPREPPVQGSAAKCAVGQRFHLCRDVVRVRLRGLRRRTERFAGHRRLRPARRRLAGLADRSCELRAGCAGAGLARAPPCPGRRARSSFGPRVAIPCAALRDTERLAEAGVAPSVGSVGDSYDNALAETINGLFKAEVIHRRGPWRSAEAVEFATLEWVDWFNNRRLLEPIGNIPPAEAEDAYYAALEDTPIAA